jgi:hypothetical protein
MNYKEARSKSAFPKRDYDSSGQYGSPMRPNHEKTYSSMLKEKNEIKSII